MKIIVAILLFISFSSLDGIITSSADTPFVFDKQVANFCPPNHEKAKESLKEYLEKDNTIKDLQKKYGLNIDRNSHNRIQALEGQLHQSKCEKLIEDLTDDEYKSVYKVSDSFFVVTFDLNKKEKYEFKYISIYNSELDLLAVYFGSIF